MSHISHQTQQKNTNIIKNSINSSSNKGLKNNEEKFHVGLKIVDECASLQPKIEGSTARSNSRKNKLPN
jgi:hypothetical protein